MRLIDRVRIQFGGIPDELPIIVADPVAQQIDQLPGDTWSESPPAEAYGCVAPPFKRFFVEAETAARLLRGHFRRQVNRVQLLAFLQLN